MVDARRLLLKRAQVVKDALATPQGEKLMALLEKEFGDPQVRDTDLKSYVELGSFQVVLWLQRMNLYTRGDEE